MILGIDVGGSGIKGALVDIKKGKMVTERHRIETPQPATPKAMIEVMGQIAEHFNYKKGPIGVGFPAIVQDGIVRSAANIDNKWIGYSGQKRIAKRTGCPVVLLNDADAAGTAEMRFGIGKKRQGVLMLLTLGTGIGSALFVNGRLVPNTELGHLYLRDSPIDAEDYASSRVREDEGLDWKEWAARLDKYLRHLEFLFSPNMFVLGGGVSKYHADFIPFLTVRAKVVPAKLRNEAGIIGAAIAAHEGTQQ
jgi:polyphosphate glucokinase